MNPLLRLSSYGIGLVFTTLGIYVAATGPNRPASMYAFLLATPFLAVAYISGKPLPTLARAEEDERRWGTAGAIFFVAYMVSGGVTLLLQRTGAARDSVIHAWTGIAHVTGTLTVVLAFFVALYSSRAAQVRRNGRNDEGA